MAPSAPRAASPNIICPSCGEEIVKPPRGPTPSLCTACAVERRRAQVREAVDKFRNNQTSFTFITDLQSLWVSFVDDLFRNKGKPYDPEPKNLFHNSFYRFLQATGGIQGKIVGTSLLIPQLSSAIVTPSRSRRKKKYLFTSGYIFPTKFIFVRIKRDNSLLIYHMILCHDAVGSGDFLILETTGFLLRNIFYSPLGDRLQSSLRREGHHFLKIPRKAEKVLFEYLFITANDIVKRTMGFALKCISEKDLRNPLALMQQAKKEGVLYFWLPE
jgi:hypothetical protein